MANIVNERIVPPTEFLFEIFDRINNNKNLPNVSLKSLQEKENFVYQLRDTELHIIVDQDVLSPPIFKFSMDVVKKHNDFFEKIKCFFNITTPEQKQKILDKEDFHTCRFNTSAKRLANI